MGAYTSSILDSHSRSHRKVQQIKGLQNVLMQYRKICQHPYLFDDVETSMNEHGLGSLDQLIRVSGKLELCNRMLPKLFRTGHRVSLQEPQCQSTHTPLGSHVLPNDKSHGHHGRLSQV
jgi:SNF2 family DNA or RNA helicase